MARSLLQRDVSSQLDQPGKINVTSPPTLLAAVMAFSVMGVSTLLLPEYCETSGPDRAAGENTTNLHNETAL